MATISRLETTTEAGFGQEITRRIEEAASFAPGLPISLDLLPSSVHGIFDYALGSGAIVAPWLFGFANVRPARLVMQLQGVAAIA